MNFHPDSDDLAVAETIAKFAEAVLKPRAQAIDETETFVAEHIPALGDLGVMGMNLPERWGGAGVSPIALYLAVEALAGACGSTVSMVTAHYLATDSILLGGGDDVRVQYLPDAATGRTLGAFALTEPRAGSNPADMSTRAVREKGGYRISGVKHFISNAAHADFIVVFAKTDPASGYKGISAFVVEPKNGGVHVSAPEKTMGLRGGHVFEVVFDCWVPESNRLGPEGSGFRTAMNVLDNGRIEVSAMCTGMAKVALAAAIDWSQTRQVDGHPIAEFQGLQWILADMATELDAARLVGLRAASLRGSGKRYSREASMAKLFASETAGSVIDRALQIHGGYGYSRDLPLERLARDARIMRIYEGSSEIQRNIIARTLLM
ncbi:acyl-CoA dehydrogenase family protein [Microvirga arabica]|uniref:acyl-CoA dehydrogenase family protein n=1 Tax=Microvirga arabica TaxID=1128671 RepID=UPI00193A3BAD|nr:acyl-CoA dehydrogenase family protein [Microvirga arabica]MBM1175272.1 acyl-CoA dehydrogenase family protein [Microvirga arabica]